jgi:hypothetical protein
VNSIDLIIARTQRLITVLTLALIAGVVVAIFIVTDISATVEKILIFILGGLMGGYATQSQFWYGRPRAAGVPDPSVTTTTSTTETVTTPTGDKHETAKTDTATIPVNP